MAGQYDQYYEWAKQASAQTGWDPDTIFAQWAWETGWFSSPNFKNNNNIAGQTWHSGLPASMKGTARPANEGGNYIKYEDPVQGYVEFVNNNSRYANVKNLKTENEQIDEIARQGWAVDPNYASSLKSLVQTNKQKYGYDSPIQTAKSVSPLKSPYKTADPAKWVEGATAGLDANFLGRLAAFGEAHGKKVSVLSGHRSVAEQETLYQRYLNGTGNLAAKPGNSRHNYGLAVDVQGWAVNVSESTYKKYGLHKPVKTPQNEPWHIEPIETLGKTTEELKAMVSAGGLSTASGTSGTGTRQQTRNRNGIEGNFDETEKGAFSLFWQIDTLTDIDHAEERASISDKASVLIDNTKAIGMRAGIVFIGIVLLIVGLFQTIR